MRSARSRAGRDTLTNLGANFGKFPPLAIGGEHSAAMSR